MSWLLWIPIAAAAALSLLSLRGERARLTFIRQRLAIPSRPLWPPATVIVPVKGADEHIARNLASLAALDYPDYELIVVARAEADLPRAALPPGARVVLSAASGHQTGEKIQNLMAAVGQARTESQVFAFADSDGAVSRLWLRALVAALDEPGAGASTGYRWHVPEHPGIWPILRSVWNAVIAGGLGPGGNRFAWGGATAIRRDTFDRLRVLDYWQETISDDYRLSEAVKDAGLLIVFAPAALVAATDHTSGRELLAWICRQMRITRFYAPNLWRIALVAHIVYCFAMAAALWLALNGSRIALGALALQIGIGMWKGARRVTLARMCLPDYAAWFARYGWLHVLLVPAGTWLWLYGCLAAAASDSIEWRGYRYKLTAPRRITGS